MMITNSKGDRVDYTDINKAVSLLHNTYNMSYEDILIGITDFFDTDDMAQAVNQVLNDNNIDMGWMED